jgi:hypothetical protein
VSHVLTNTTTLKVVTDKIDARLEFLDKIFLKIHDIQKYVKRPNKNVALLEERNFLKFFKAPKDIKVFIYDGCYRY